MDDLFSFFSEHLYGIVPTIYSSSDYYLEKTDILMVETDMDGELYIVPLSAGNATDSIYKHQLATVDALADEKNEFQLSGFEFGRYRVYAVSRDSVVSNIPEEFYVVPEISPPTLRLVSDTVDLGDSILVSSSRDGMLYFVKENTPLGLIYFRASRFLIDSIEVAANVSVKLSTSGLDGGKNCLYAVDKYGFISEPYSVIILSAGVEKPVTEGIRIYPNPARELIIIESEQTDTYSIKITSLNGQRIYSTQKDGPTHQIDLSSFGKGVYIITIRSKDIVTTRKIIKL